MKKIIIILFVALLLSGCSVSDDEKLTQVQSEVEQTQTEVSTETPTPTQTPEPTPVPTIKSVELPIVVSDNERFLYPVNIEEDPNFETEMCTPIGELVSAEDEAFYVEFDPDRGSNLQLNRPSMPTYTWYINGSEDDKIAEVVIEFDILETIHPLHPAFFGYEKGYFVILHHFQDIPLLPPWGVNDSPDHKGDANRYTMINTPEFGVDLRKYAKQDGDHIKITIPYSEFEFTAKDLTLQFLPGTTFANLSVNLLGSNELNSEIIDEIFKVVEYPQRDLRHDVMQPALQIPEDNIFPLSDAKDEGSLSNLLYTNSTMGDGLIIGNDGSINMPVSLYDLGEYADEVTGDYAVIPEGLVSVFATVSTYSYLGYINDYLPQLKNNKRMIFDFMFENMMDETGQIYGIYDLDQQKMVATDRKSPALPILSTLLTSVGPELWSTLSDDEIDFMVNSIIENDLIRVGDILYYAPYGISDDGVMSLKLSDFTITTGLFALCTEYSQDRSRLNEKYGCAMLLEGLANSLKLILEGQEQNLTRLPSTSLDVAFSNDGNTYELYPSDTFNINDSFFSLGLMYYDELKNYNHGFEHYSNEERYARKLSGAKDGVYSERQQNYIRECEAVYAEYYNYYTIMNTLFESSLNTYNFLKAQPSKTAYGPKYNVHTGEMIEIYIEELYSEFHKFAPFINRFGTPATSANYYVLFGMFNNEALIKETMHLVIVNFEMWQSDRMLRSKPFDYSNPNTFAKNGFNIWGYDSLYYTFSGAIPSSYMTRNMYETSGTNLARENWLEFTMRKLNGQIRNGDNHVSIDDAFPLFYDHLTKVEIK